VSVADEREQRRQQDRAESFRPNAQLEAAAKVRDRGGRLSPQLRMQLGFYEITKAAAKAAGINTDPQEDKP
jgi:hypothetical protein